MTEKDELIEVVARAIWEQREAQRCAPSQGEEWLPTVAWDELHRILKLYVKAEAEAAIASIRPIIVEEARKDERERCDLIVRQQWHAAVKTLNLQPGTAIEKFAADCLNAIRGISLNDSQDGER